MPSRERRAERIGVRRAWASVTLVVVALATGISAWALTASSGPTYRTAGARLASVFQTLDTSGTVTAASQASLSFQVAGQVASVAVSLGEKVTAGQVVATLDTSALTAQLDAASSALSAADQTLSTDEASDASATTAASVDSASIASGQVAPTGGTTGQISAAQGVLVADQHTSDLARQAASADLAAAQSACPATGPGAGTGPGPGPGSGTGPGPGPGSGTAANAPAAGALAAGSGPHSPQGCIAALTTAFSSQAKVASDEAAVAHDELALAKLLSAASASNGPSPRRSSTAFSGGAGTGSSTTGAATPAQLAVDQATIDADQVQLIKAQTSLDEAQLVSPIAGTVASL
ncbi:MAG: biotin/lipoyl-binding protein, partial [Actinomycetota bacterium]|nr:biotin/lipoyl-binding protein [Actinomycetota bacterium]